MAGDRLGSDYSENMSDATTCSCATTNSIDKCSPRNCGMFHEPFFLHPPGTRPRDGIYINPMSAFIGESPQKQRDNAGESFYLHSPHDLVYTRITHLFCDSEKTRNVDERGDGGDGGDGDGINDRKDETLTVKVDVHMNNGSYDKPVGNGNSIRSDSTNDSGTEHAYEQIRTRPEENVNVDSSSDKRPITDDASENGSRSRIAGRRFSRSSSGSESSNTSSELRCYSSTTSTPSLSRNSSNERVGKRPKPPQEPSLSSSSTTPAAIVERKSTPIATATTAEIERESKIPITGLCVVEPPPPPPPPPPPDAHPDPVASGTDKRNDSSAREERRDTKSDTRGTSAFSTANESEAFSEHQPEVQTGSTSSDTEDSKTGNQVSHLVGKHMVLPFVPPKFINAADSNTLLKPSEYLKSICKSWTKNSLSKARSVDNLDIQSRSTIGEENGGVGGGGDGGGGRGGGSDDTARKESGEASGPPPPPLPPMPMSRDNSCQAATTTATTTNHDPETSKTPQPLATISIQDLTSVQLRRTNVKMHAAKTFSAPPPRSVSMTNVAEPFFVQKTDLIAELKKTKDIPGIKKLKVERAKSEKTQEQRMITEISRAFSVTNFVDQIPEKDSSGNVIPIWKRQMLARKAAERAKKDLEEQIARENEEKRRKAIPPWKRQLLAKKDCEDKKPQLAPHRLTLHVVPPTLKIEISPIAKKDGVSPATPAKLQKPIDHESRTENEEKKSSTPTIIRNETNNNNNNVDENDNDHDDDDNEAPIIPWRAQLRKTNSKLNIID